MILSSTMRNHEWRMTNERQERYPGSITRKFLFAVVRGASGKQVMRFQKQLIKEASRTSRWLFDTGAENVMRKLSDEFAGTDMVVGAGTVLDEVAARISIMNGAKFIVSPSFNEKISRMCNLYTVPYLPGCGSVTEIQMALETGCEVIEAVPGWFCLGPGFIKDVHGPIPWVDVMPFRWRKHWEHGQMDCKRSLVSRCRRCRWHET